MKERKESEKVTETKKSSMASLTKNRFYRFSSKQTSKESEKVTETNGVVNKK